MIFVDCNANKTLQSWFEFFYTNGPLQICFIKKNQEVSWKKTLDYNIYEKSRLVDFLYVLMIYQHDEPFKIIGVFNYYKCFH